MRFRFSPQLCLSWFEVPVHQLFPERLSDQFLSSFLHFGYSLAPCCFSKALLLLAKISVR